MINTLHSEFKEVKKSTHENQSKEVPNQQSIEINKLKT